MKKEFFVVETKYFLHFFLRLIYYKLRINKIYNPFRIKKKKIQKLKLEDIEKALISLNIKAGDSILVHSSLSNIDAKPEEIIAFLKKYIGNEGNILMPTHPKLNELNGVFGYDVTNSKSTVGYLTECFRKSEGVKRSLHPFSSVAAWGKDKELLLKNNLDQSKPLPHGKNSPYFRFAMIGGKAIFLGVTLRRATIMHVAEEVLDENFPIKDFFKEYKVIVKDRDYNYGDYNVRKADLNIAKYYLSKSKVLSKWKTQDIISTIKFGNNFISCVDCKKVVNLMITDIKNGSTNYPLAPKNPKN